MSPSASPPSFIPGPWPSTRSSASIWSKAVWLIGIIAAIYTTWGGLKAVAWADLFQGSALILGGIVTLIVGLKAVGGVGSFLSANADKLHVIMPADHPVIPWTTLIVGLWIPNFYYWGLNQFITQRTLAAKSLKQGQLGIIFAAMLKLLIPFIIIVPGHHLLAAVQGGAHGPGSHDRPGLPAPYQKSRRPGLAGLHPGGHLRGGHFRPWARFSTPCRRS